MEDEQFKQNLTSLRRKSTQDLFAGYYYDHEIAHFTERDVVQKSGLNEVIMQTIHKLEQKSQMQEPQTMATSSSSATVTGIYSMQHLPKNNPSNREDIERRRKEGLSDASSAHQQSVHSNSN